MPLQSRNRRLLDKHECGVLVQRRPALRSASLMGKAEAGAKAAEMLGSNQTFMPATWLLTVLFDCWPPALLAPSHCICLLCMQDQFGEVGWAHRAKIALQRLRVNKALSNWLIKISLDPSSLRPRSCALGHLKSVLSYAENGHAVQIAQLLTL